MKYIDNDAFYSVRVSSREVESFRRSWPCSHLPDCAITFKFDKRNDDLVDIIGSDKYDGEDLLALSHDAQNYAKDTL